MATVRTCDEQHVDSRGLVCADYRITVVDDTRNEYGKDYCHEHYAAEMSRLTTGGAQTGWSYTIARVG